MADDGRLNLDPRQAALVLLWSPVLAYLRKVRVARFIGDAPVRVVWIDAARDGITVSFELTRKGVRYERSVTLDFESYLVSRAGGNGWRRRFVLAIRELEKAADRESA